jgi:uncharacterized membrane protein YgdD (TMEM256/DUF423 family)
MAQASDLSFRASRPKPLVMRIILDWRVLKNSGRHQRNSAGRRILQARRLCHHFENMFRRHASRIAAIAGLLAVVLGALGAHGWLNHLLVQNGTITIWEKAVFYHFIHAVMLFVLAERKTLQAVAWWSFLAGIVIFSGSLYLLAVTNVKWLGAITPFGGVAFIVGWVCLILKKQA